MKNEKKGSFLGLLPLIVFLVAYMGTGLEQEALTTCR